jgi:hypothetical protein
MAFDLSNYEDVDTRIHKFWDAHPNGRISTEIVYQRNDEQGAVKQVIIRAKVWKDKNSGKPDATDYAEEIQGATPVNRASFIENCSTSAIGRALATLGFAKKGARPSTVEMTKAERIEAAPQVDPWAAEVASPLEVALTSMGAIPFCECGLDMVRKEGTNSSGVPYSGWVCQNHKKEHNLWDKRK